MEGREAALVAVLLQFLCLLMHFMAHFSTANKKAMR